jgi:hypothetical protein
MHTLNPGEQNREYPNCQLHARRYLVCRCGLKTPAGFRFRQSVRPRLVAVKLTLVL